MKVLEYFRVCFIIIFVLDMTAFIVLTKNLDERNIQCDPNFIDSGGYTCQDYADYEYCTPFGGYGPGWDTEYYGDFNRWANDNFETAIICPQCGCKKESNNLH